MGASSDASGKDDLTYGNDVVAGSPRPAPDSQWIGRYPVKTVAEDIWTATLIRTGPPDIESDCREMLSTLSDPKRFRILCHVFSDDVDNLFMPRWAGSGLTGSTGLGPHKTQ